VRSSRSCRPLRDVRVVRGGRWPRACEWRHGSVPSAAGSRPPARPQATAQLPEDLGPAQHVPRQQDVVGPAGRMTTLSARLARAALAAGGAQMTCRDDDVDSRQGARDLSRHSLGAGSSRGRTAFARCPRFTRRASCHGPAQPMSAHRRPSGVPRNRKAPAGRAGRFGPLAQTRVQRSPHTQPTPDPLRTPRSPHLQTTRRPTSRSGSTKWRRPLR
jgi:hypothetical protein